MNALEAKQITDWIDLDRNSVGVIVRGRRYVIGADSEGCLILHSDVRVKLRAGEYEVASDASVTVVPQKSRVLIVV